VPLDVLCFTTSPLTVGSAGRRRYFCRRLSTENRSKAYRCFNEEVARQRWCLFPGERAPPRSANLCLDSEGL